MKVQISSCRFQVTLIIALLLLEAAVFSANAKSTYSMFQVINTKICRKRQPARDGYLGVEYGPAGCSFKYEHTIPNQKKLHCEYTL